MKKVIIFLVLCLLGASITAQKQNYVVSEVQIPGGSRYVYFVWDKAQEINIGQITLPFKINPTDLEKTVFEKKDTLRVLLNKKTVETKYWGIRKLIKTEETDIYWDISQKTLTQKSVVNTTWETHKPFIIITIIVVVGVVCFTILFMQLFSSKTYPKREQIVV